MYAIPCGATSDALDALSPGAENLKARMILESALNKTEEMWITQEKPACKEDKRIIQALLRGQP